MTAHYNGYWNAKENIRVALKDFKAAHEENYDSILPLYVYPNNVESKSLYPVMDTSISKCATAIKRHSMPERKTGKQEGEEWVKWIDDNWMVIGQAHFYKREYNKAIEMFRYVSLTYLEDKNVHWSRLWMIKSHIESKEFNTANRMLKELQLEIDAQETTEEKSKSKSKNYKTKRAKQIKKDEPEPVKITKQFILEKKLAETHLYLSQHDFKKSVPALLESIELAKKRDLKARLYFILGQIYQETGQPQLAGDAFHEVEKLHPNYDMTFYAQINQVFVSSGKNTAELRRKLLKLSRDEKNVDYFDLIFYALADLELKEKNEEKGIKYLKKSIAYSANNTKQKSKSYMRLGDLFFKKKDYPPAQSYYDSTLSILPESHERHFELKRLNKSLKTLVSSLSIIREQDSLRNLADNFTEKEIIKKIEKMIDEKKRADEKAAQQQQSFNQPGIPGQGPRLAGGSGGIFWAYDNQLRTQGYNDFKLLWGIRKNEDNWRRRNKSQTNFDGDENELDSTGTKLEYTVDYYLKNIPFSDSQKAFSDSLLSEAHYAAGNVFNQDLNETNEALKSFNTVNNKYKTQRVAPASHYQVYLIEQERKNASIKNRMVDIILADYPESEYAKLLKNPDYLKNKEKELKKNENNYAKLYKLFSNEEYKAVILATEGMVNEQDSLNPYVCQSLYLRASSIGYLLPNKEETKTYEEALELVIKACPGSAVAEKAQNTLNYIRKVSSENLTTIGLSKYRFNADKPHFFIYVHNRKGGKRINDVKVDFSDFGSKYFSPLKLSVSSAIYNSTKQLVIVKSFKNAKEAKDYLTTFKVNKDKVSAYNKSDNYFLISQNNYLEFFKTKDLNGYTIFYQKNYK